MVIQSDLAAEVAQVFRRLFATLTVVAALFGFVQPAFACASTDCCGTGSPAECGGQTGFASTRIEANGCCTARPAATSSVSIVPRARQGAEHAAGSLDPIISPASWPGRLSLAASAVLPQLRTAYCNDESSIYLLTARLRL